MVRTVKLSDGKQIPLLAWGNGSQGLSSSGQTATDLGAVAITEGIKHIDTAQLYETETETGEAIKKSGVKRSDVWVTSKISHNTITENSAENVKRSVIETIEKLGGIPDLLLIHNPFVVPDGKIGQFWTHVEALVKDGTLKGCSLGVSNFRPQDFEAVFEVATIKPVCHQLEFHPYVLNHLDPVLAIHEKHGIVAEAYGPLTPILRHPGGPLKPILEKIAANRGIDIGQVLLLWTMQRGVVAVTTSTKPENIKKLASLEGFPDLSQAELDEIEKVGRQVHYRHYSEHMTKDFPSPNFPDGK